MRGEVGGDSPATLPVPARGWWLRAPSSLSFPFRSSCFCSGSKRGAGGGCCCPPRCRPPCPASPRLALGTCPAPTAPGAGLGSAQRARELLCKSALMRRGPGVAGGQGWSSEGPRGDSPAGSAPGSGQLGQERARLCAACGPEQSVCSCCFSYFYFYFWKGGSLGWSSVGCPSSRPGHPCGGTAPVPRGSNAVTACGRGELGLGAALPSPSPRSPPAPFGSPPSPSAPCLPLGASMQVLRCAGAAKGDGVCSPSNCVLKKKSPPNSDLEVPKGAEPSGQELGWVWCRSFTWRGWGSGGAAGFGLIC